MIRLVDYFAVVGYDDCDASNTNGGGDQFQQQRRNRSSVGKAKIIQRFPTNESQEAAAAAASAATDTDTTSSEEEFDSNVHCFCQPHQGWRLYTKPEPPTFFVSVLTDIRGRRRYCACLNFSEPYRPFRQVKRGVNGNSKNHNSIMRRNSDGSSNEQDDSDSSDRSVCRQKCTCDDESVHDHLDENGHMDNKSDLEDSTVNNMDELSSSFIQRQNFLIHDHRKQQQPANLMIKRQVSLNRAAIHQPIKPASLYSAKSLVIISRLDYPDLFKAFLSLIYASYVDKRADNDNKLLEQIVANMLTIQVSAPGTAQLSTFSLSGDDKHCMQAQASLNVPCTDSCVYKLFKELGIGNVLRLVCAVLADYKILFFSRSYIKLYEACKAIEALLYPLKYTGVFVPVLPCFGSFLEFPAAPTPYIIGIHSAFRRLIEDMHQDSLQECVKVDIDCATLSMPQGVDDLINGSINSSCMSSSVGADVDTHVSSKNYAAVGSSATSSGITSISSSSSSSFEQHNNNNSNFYSGQACSNYNMLNCNSYNTSSSSSKSSSGLPHYLYDSTLNLLYALLKPDVLKADELAEFGQFSQNNKQTSSSSSSAATNDLTNTSAALSANVSNVSLNGECNSSSNNGSKSTGGCSNNTASGGTSSSSDIDAIWMDKMLRAVFVRLFAQLFAGYRYCLLVIRINPKPVICFNKQAFLSQHRLSHENEFMNRLLDSMSFQRFIEERGPSYRNCDVFDELYASVQSQLLAECGSSNTAESSSSSSSSCAGNVMLHLKQIAEKLYKYEYPHTQLLRSQSKKGSRAYFNSSCCSPSGSTQNASTTTITTPSNSNSTIIGGENSSNSCAIKNYIHHMPYRSYSKIKLPTPDAYRRIYAEKFPLLDSAEIERLMSTTNNTTITGINNSEHQQQLSTTSLDPITSTSSLVSPRNHLCRPYLVPYGPPIETVQNMSNLNRYFINLFTRERDYVYSSSSSSSKHHHRLHKQMMSAGKPPLSHVVENSSIQRKIDTISYCVANIFACNFKEVKKTLNSSFRALRDPRAGLHLCECLQAYVKRNQVILINEQFEFVCKLLNEALVNQNRLDEHGLAYAVLPLSSAFYRKLNNGTIDQCIYTRLQQHPVWSNIHFWEMAFYSDVQRSLRPVYLTNEEFHAEQERESVDQSGISNNNHNNLELPSGSSSGESPSSSGHNTVDADTIDEMINQIINGEETSKRNNKPRKNSSSFSKAAPMVTAAAHSSSFAATAGENLYARPAEKTALEICGEQMETFLQQTDEQREAYVRNEQGIIRSHVLHYITQMVNMKIPFDINSRNKQIASEISLPTPSEVKKTAAMSINNETVSIKNTDCESSSIHAQMTHSPSNEDNNSLAASDDSGYEPNPLAAPAAASQQDQQMPQQQQFLDMDASPEYLHTFGEMGYEVWRFVRKFVDHVCQEGMLSDSQRQALHYNLADVISMQIQMLETVYAESRKVPARTKPPMDQLKPEYMLPGECVLEPTPLRCYMVPDGRDEVCGLSFSGTCLLPAEGVLILTNYRCMFRGIPVNDSLMSDSIITRSFPIAALIKEKRCGNSYKLAASLNVAHDTGHSNEPHSSNDHPHPNGTNTLHDGIQMRSSTFQLIKVYFDEESPTEKVDRFRHLLFKLRYPSSILDMFCFGYDTTPNGKSSSVNIYPNSVALLGIYNNGNSSGMAAAALDNSQDGMMAANELFKQGVKTESKQDALKHFAKNTLRKAGLMSRNNSGSSSKAAGGGGGQTSSSSSIAARTPETARKSLQSSMRQSSFTSSINSQNMTDKDVNKPNEMTNEEGLSVIEENIDYMNLVNGNHIEAKQLERLIETMPAYKDFLRLGLLNLVKDDQACSSMAADYTPTEMADSAATASTRSQFRICTLNLNYQLCRTLPSIFVVPRESTDDCIRKNAKCHRQGRLPVIVWRHARNKALLLRASGFHGKGFIGMLIKTGSSAATANSTQTKETTNETNSNHNGGQQQHNNKFNTMASLSSGSHNSHNQSLLQRSNMVGGPTGLKSQNMDYYDTNSSSQVDALNESFCSSLNSACVQPVVSAAMGRGGVASSVPLYIICERSQIKSFRSSTEPSAGRYFFHPIDIHDVKETKNSFKKLCRACVPSNASAELLTEMMSNNQNTLHKSSQASKTNGSTTSGGRTFGLANKFSSSNKSNRKKSMSSFNSSSAASQYQSTVNHIDSTGTLQRHSSSNIAGGVNGKSSSGNTGSGGGGGLFKEIQESKWFEQLQLIMSVSNLITEKMEDQNASCMICLEDGWDFTAQCSSLAQLFMDPYYRTLEGFAVLVEKEWLAMGHRFTRRNNHTIDDQTGFAPIFLQFLDLVYQTISQFPNAFEFNEFYLEFLAYHYVSNRFKTFLLDSESERVQYGLINTTDQTSATMSAQLTPNMNKYIFEPSSLDCSSIGLNTNVSYNFASSISPSTCCIWEYIQKVHFNTAKFFNFNYQPNIWRECVLRPSSELFKLKLWSYYFRENLCIGPVYDMDLISIGALNSSSTTTTTSESKTTSATTNTTSGNHITKVTGNLDECLWYPVPIQNACDYYEQLEQILPSQYEILIKQIIRKYRLNEKFQAKPQQQQQMNNNKLASSMSYFSLCNDTSFSTFDYLHKILTSNVPAAAGVATSSSDTAVSDVYINWKALWDYFYQLAENRILKETNKEGHKSLINETFLSIQQTNSIQIACSLTKPYMSTLPTNSLSTATATTHHVVNGNKTLELKVKKQDNQQPSSFILQSSSSSYCSQASPTPPFPRVQDDKSGVHHHNYQIFLFSSTNTCKLCNSSFKSTTQYVGLKCKYCSLVCHEQCAKDFPTECTDATSTTQTCSLSEQICSSKDPRAVNDDDDDDEVDDENELADSIHASKSSVNSYMAADSRLSHTCLPNATKLDIGSVCAAGLKNDFRPGVGGSTKYHDQDSMGGILGYQQQFYVNNNNSNMMEMENGDRGGGTGNFITWSQSSSSNEHQTYAGYLKKQGALFKQWKERYFVLDSIKHQLRYYDSHNDLIVKGVVDLSEVESINQGISSGSVQQSIQQAYNPNLSVGHQTSSSSSTKKALSTLNAMTGTSFGEAIDPKSCFELKTSKRVYYFCAKSPQEASKWVKQLEICCIDS